MLDAASFDAPATKRAAELLDGRRGGSVLVVFGPDEDHAVRSFRNLERVNIADADNTGVAQVIGAAQLVLSRTALDHLTDLAKKPVRGAAASTEEATA